MIEPQVTAVSGRRYLALLIDSALVAAPAGLVAYLQSEDFAIVGRDDAGGPLVDPNEFERMESLLDFELFGQSQVLGIDLVRAQEIGDSVRVFGADSYQWGLATAALVSIVVFLTVPAIMQRTIGMLPFGLEIRDLDGHRPSLTAHLKRSIAGVVDMIPGVVPGLLGMLVASSSAHQQRIGDRLAGTIVVDRKLADFYTRAEGAGPVTVNLGAEIASDAASTVPVTAERPTDVPSPSGEPIPADHAALRLPDPTVAAPADAPAPAATPSAATPSAADTPAADTPTVGMADPGGDVPLPPPPVHRKPPSERPRPTSGDGSTTEGTPDRPVDGPQDASSSADGTQQPLPESIDQTWAAPRVEPAPVWQPAPFDPAPVEVPVQRDDLTLEDILTGEPTVAELIGSEPVTSDGRSDPVREDDRGSTHAAESGTSSAKAPVWSEKWRAWMYWDQANKHWLRHDTSTNTWVRVD